VIITRRTLILVFMILWVFLGLCYSQEHPKEHLTVESQPDSFMNMVAKKTTDIFYKVFNKKDADTLDQSQYQVGDTGPCGGIVFCVDDMVCWEISEPLGEYTFDNAIKVAREYRGNGFSDWFLPSINDLNTVYLCLQKGNTKMFDINYLWSSTAISDSTAWGQRFRDGRQISAPKKEKHLVRAVRKTIMSNP